MARGGAASPDASPSPPAAPERCACSAATSVAKLSANCCNILSATVFIMRPPKAAALPLIDTSLEPTNSDKPPSDESMRASIFMDAPELPVLSVPLPIRRRLRFVGSTSCTSTSPLNDIFAGPTFTDTVPLWWFSLTRSVSFAPGIHPATASTFCRNSQAISGEHAMGNVLSI